MSLHRRHEAQSKRKLLLSDATKLDGSPALEDEARISSWGTTLRDVSALMLPYLFGFCVAFTHYLLFSHLNQKRIGIDTTFPQSWVTSVSLVLVTVFRLCLCLALGNAFTQHLWRIVRLNPVKVADLDRYYSMQKYPLALLHSRVLLKAPSLYAMAFLGFTIGLAVIFPPGALTVEGKLYESVRTQSVGIFDASFRGNGFLAAAIDQSLVRGGELLVHPYFEPKSIVSSTAKMTLIGGALPVLTSPCGPNCTYSITFDGPQVKCDSYEYNDTTSIPISVSSHSEEVGYLPAWLSDWTPTGPSDVDVDCPQGEEVAQCLVSSYYENIFFERYSLDFSNTNVTVNDTVGIYPRFVHRLECIPGYARYTTNITFNNGVPLIDLSSTYIGSLVDFWKSSGRVMITGTGRRWLDPQGLVKAANLFAVLTSFAQPLQGQIAGPCNIIHYRDGTIRIDDYYMGDEEMSGSVMLAPTDTIIMDTAFNTERFKLHNQSERKIDVLNITEYNINQALQNITIALMKLHSIWNTTTNVTQSNYQNVFIFSPIPLIVPYACCLAAVLPFLLLGYSSLRSNGVPALSGGFVQTLMTTTGSEALRDAAAVGCLGGQRNVPRQLKDMEIMYGELRNERNQDSNIRRATFGVKEEIVKLEKEAPYGR